MNKFLIELEQEAIRRKIPIIGPEKAVWLHEKIKEFKPQEILELGTAAGYSGIVLGSEGAHLTTIDKSIKIQQEGKENLEKAKINATVIFADIPTYLHELTKTKKEYFDLIFIDFEKREYLTALPHCIHLVKVGGHIITDNVLMDKSKDFLEAVTHHPQLETEIIHIKDGLTLSRRIA
ncbi:class I SAM-dependent methyltransferase [Candidatus Woesearchaeota archaeon]|nr:class I SAM-dependent methyltransferase [Candidatus Woesearchaeota archaeon]